MSGHKSRDCLPTSWIRLLRLLESTNRTVEASNGFCLPDRADKRASRDVEIAIAALQEVKKTLCGTPFTAIPEPGTAAASMTRIFGGTVNGVLFCF
uniref:RUN domain-containing protein n=1 Tax=Panagrellus redivivus TaxID=6233 RepID=A0A7E4UPA2_PANRE